MAIDPERKAVLEPQRMKFAINQLTKRGFKIDEQDAKKLKFTFKGHTVTLYPFSGWFSGKTVNDGRGLMDLLTQLNTK